MFGGDSVKAMASIPGHQRVVSVLAEGTVRFFHYHVSSVSVVSEVPLPATTATVKGVDVVGSGSRAVVVRGSDLFVFDAILGDLVASMSLAVEATMVRSLTPETVVVVAATNTDKTTNAVITVNIDDLTTKPVTLVPHKFPIVAMVTAHHPPAIISIDTKGIIEVWTVEGKPQVNYTTKLQTDFLDVVRAKLIPTSMVVCGTHIAVATELKIWVFDYVSGKRIGVIDVTKPVAMALFPSQLVFSTAANTQRLWLNLMTTTNPDIIGKCRASHLVALGNDMPPLIAANEGNVHLYDNGIDGEPEDLAPPQKLAKVSVDDIVLVTLHTSKGDIRIKLYPKLAPKTVDNFVSLIHQQYYTNHIFHRVVKGFIIQTGDPTGTGTGGRAANGTYVADEFSPLLTHAKPFMVSMANAGANTNGSQFFITTRPAVELDGKHLVFGEVIAGFDVVRTIERVKTINERPKTPVELGSILIQR